jgi:hypothetical protein
MRRLSLLLLLLVGGCAEATAPVAVAASIEEVVLRTVAERTARPFVASIEGGAAVTIRGFAYFGCGSAAVSAQRRGQRIDVAISARNADRPCVAIIPYWRPYRVELRDLEPGVFEVSVDAIGHDERRSAAIRVQL